MSITSAEGMNLEERLDPYQICVNLDAIPSGGDLTVSITSSGNSATGKIKIYRACFF